ncbi:MAG: tRNA (adenosine(37)-N6)-threonylcarbamoyltransferase complex ATPase subunit type 1 TsaE [Gammaproteobacteria bacterium]
MKLADEQATRALGAWLAQRLRALPGAVIYLEGPLGAGKTTLARALLHGLGVEGPVKSPTYTLVEPYEAAGRRILHLDLYRLNDPLEFDNLGLADDPPTRSLWLVEWPSRAAELLPPADVLVQLQLAGSARRVQLQAGAGRDALIAGWQSLSSS